MTINNNNMDIRCWFENLPSGEERSASIAVSDPAFAGMLVSIVCNGNSPSFFSPPGISLSNEPLKVRELIEAYNMHTHALSESSTSDSSKSTATKVPLNHEQLEAPIESPTSDSSDIDNIKEKSSTMLDEHKLNIGDNKILDGKPFTEEIVSTALRIQPQTEDATSTDPKKDNSVTEHHSEQNFEEKNDQDSSTSTATSTGGEKNDGESPETRNTWGFDNDLSITIPAESEANKKLIEGTKKKLNTCSSLKLVPKLEANLHVNNDTIDDKIDNGDDVDRLVHFSALNVTSRVTEAPTETSKVSDETAKKRERAQKIASSKMSAARAMSLRNTSIQNNGAYDNLLQHLCLVFTSALGLLTARAKVGQLPSNEKGDEAQVYQQIELLTIDPLYLNKTSQNGLEFLSDADKIIKNELQKIGKTNVTSQYFLSDTKLEQSSTCTNVSPEPDWFSYFKESEETCIPTIIILLARIEQSIRKSYLNSNDKNISATSLIDAPNSRKDAPMQTNFPFLSLVEPNTTPNIGTLFTETLDSWKYLSENNFQDDVAKSVRALIQDVIIKAPNQWHHNAEEVLKSFALKDLLLVPICSVLLIRPPSALGINQSLAYIRLLVSQWSHIISVCLSKLKDEISKVRVLKISDSLDMDLDSLLDDSVIAKPGNGKKKKKKKKKKKRKVNSSNPVEDSEQQNSKCEDTSSSKDIATKIIDEPSKNVATLASDCAISVVSSASVATSSSRKISNMDSTTTESQLSMNNNKTSVVSFPVQQINNNTKNSCVSGSTGVEDTDGHSSDGWETVEPKSVRSKRLAGLSSKNTNKQSNEASTPQSPGNSRRNRKAKSRQRAKQKAKEKDLPKRDTLDDGISKRGSNTIKALMEERNKHTSAEMKANVDIAKQASAKSSVADQNTAQTIPESLSGVSSAPVQTLVGPGNNNSAGSSVASSLEAPHATRHKPHHHHDSYKEDDVGYHLLKVCDRLSADMSTFMRRRSSALVVRRRERAVLLAALQETVQTIWASHCEVELYGSCATQLDLPSSDLDVVIRGLNGSGENTYLQQNDINNPVDKERSLSIDSSSKSFEAQRQKASSPSSSSTSSSSPSNSPSSYMSYQQNFYPPLTANGNRVLRLATELERQPWAVQVKAIPTASVPVIKILTDPSRLPGGATGSEWMLHQQNMAAAAVAAADMKMASGLPSTTPNSYHSAQLPWRGADIMNGLLSLDITFEGPEHGGVGSTVFSTQVVQDVVSETGLPPDSTPVVQVIMIIKELLAQRRLNEPFSGGLSSYAILLLVIAVMKERRVIKEEIERVERQQRAVASSCTTTKTEKKPLMEKKSSWAAIAMKSSKPANVKSGPWKVPVQPNEKQNIAYEDEQASTQAVKEKDSHSLKVDVTVDTRDSVNQTPQGYNDVLEVLCSGEPTAGKLLMHFLLFYGRHFDARTCCIDVSGTHHPEFSKLKGDPKRNWSPFMTRKPGGTYNPITEVYTVDPLVVYDPLEGRESNNVTRSCYAWPTIAWTFDQCFNTLSGVVELGSDTNNNRRVRENGSDLKQSNTIPSSKQHIDIKSPTSTDPVVDCLEDTRNVENDLSPLLELLLCF